MIRLIVLFLLLCSSGAHSVEHYMFVMKERQWLKDKKFLLNGSFKGAQVMYSWRELEPQKNQYDFRKVTSDIHLLAQYGKKVFIQLQDVSFRASFKPVPDYILNEERYRGGVTRQSGYNRLNAGWVAMRWNSSVRSRFQQLISRLGQKFDGRVAGINLQESALANKKPESLPGFSFSGYRDALIETMSTLSSSFSKSTPMQYANFMPGEWLPWQDRGYLRSIYLKGEKMGVCLGAPDLMPNKKSQLNHAYKMMRSMLSQSCRSVAVQNGNYIGETATTSGSQKVNLVNELYDFAVNRLNVKFVFWVKQEPYFSEYVLPYLRKHSFKKEKVKK